jgi:hypothetical protein
MHCFSVSWHLLAEKSFQPMKMSPPQRRVLDNLARGKPAEFGIGCPKSSCGGAAWTMEALRKKGLIDDNGITGLGLASIDKQTRRLNEQ